MTRAHLFRLLVLGAAVPVGIVVRIATGYPASWVVSGAVLVGVIAVAIESAAFAARRKRRVRKPLPLEPAETAALVGPATRVLRTGGVSGELTLTSARLVFRPFEPTLLDRDTEWRLDEISAMERARTFAVVPNAICVAIDGREERFVVASRDAWLSAFDAARRPSG
jgi:hypothetical protein